MQFLFNTALIRFQNVSDRTLKLAAAVEFARRDFGEVRTREVVGAYIYACLIQFGDKVRQIPKELLQAVFLVVQRLTLDGLTHELGMRCLQCLQNGYAQLYRNKVIIVIDEGNQLAQEIRSQLEAACSVAHLNYQFAGMTVNEQLAVNLE